MKRKTKVIILCAAAVVVCISTILILLYCGVLHINNPSKSYYPVNGVDVSAYQGDIDWQLLSGQDISYAYIKATEGSSHTDKYFENNWENAGKCGLRIGAYHFFSFESAGKTQAEHFCETVSAVDGMLPPVVDVEFYGRFKTAADINVDDIAAQLRDFVDILAEEYGMKPVIYVSEETYETIVKGRFDDCDLWYRSVYSKIPEDVKWKFWQYSNRHCLDGYNGEENFIDMNVFNGSAEEFVSYPDR